MLKSILIYGLISGLVIVGGIIASMFIQGGAPHSSVWLGYLIMVIGLACIFVAVRQHRTKLGGVIKFWPALAIGLGISVLASLAYVVIWETYVAVTHYEFMDGYIASMLEAKRAAGVTGEAYAKFAAEMEAMKKQYENPLFRYAMTFVEIFPVGVVISLLSAVVLRFPQVLPARKAS